MLHKEKVVIFMYPGEEPFFTSCRQKIQMLHHLDSLLHFHVKSAGHFVCLL